eukprot:4178261-Lingulodinium_polyedra.AAC.1
MPPRPLRQRSEPRRLGWTTARCWCRGNSDLGGEGHDCRTPTAIHTAKPRAHNGVGNKRLALELEVDPTRPWTIDEPTITALG